MTLSRPLSYSQWDLHVASDQADAGPKRKHHYVEADFTIYRKAFSADTIDQIGLDSKQKIMSNKKQQNDLNNNARTVSTLMRKRKTRICNIETDHFNCGIKLLSYQKGTQG